MGGLDLCYGRYETLNYPLKEPNENLTIWLGKDYYNIMLASTTDVKNYKQSDLDKNTQPRMPWRDQAIKVVGPLTKELINHFL